MTDKSEYHKKLIHSHQALSDLGVPRDNQTDLLNDTKEEMKEEGIPAVVNSNVHGSNGHGKTKDD